MARLSIIKRGSTNYTIGATQLVSVTGQTVEELNVGDNNQFIYFKNGIPEYSTINKGSDTKLIFIRNGIIEESTGMAGTANWPVYLYGGTISECSDIDEGEGTW